MKRMVTRALAQQERVLNLGAGHFVTNQAGQFVQRMRTRRRRFRRGCDFIGLSEADVRGATAEIMSFTGVAVYDTVPTT